MHAGDLTGRHGVELDAGEAETIVQIGDVGELAAEAIERFDHDHVEEAAIEIGTEFLITGPEATGATDRPVLVAAHKRPALPLDKPAADLELVRRRGIALVLAAVPGVDSGAHQAFPLGLLVASACSLRNPARKPSTILLSPRDPLLLVPRM